MSRRLKRSEHNAPASQRLEPASKRPALQSTADTGTSTRNVAKTEARHLFSGERWFAIQSQPHREPAAAKQLRNQGFHVFLPLRPTTWRHARQVETRLVPFFPGYLFVALDLDRHRWRSVNSTFGVQKLVMFGGETRPTPIPAGIIEAFMSKADERGCLHPNGLLRVGEKVQIQAGAFANQLGKLIALDDDAGRVRVLIELLGGRIPAILSCDRVIAAR